MATAAAEPYSGRHSARPSSIPITRSPLSPDTASAIYPERAIRPLPKSRLKSKLSPEQQSTIVYPPDPPPVSPQLSFSVRENGHLQGDGAAAMRRPNRPMVNGAGHHHATTIAARRDYRDPGDHHHDHCTCGHDDGVESGDEEIEFAHPDYRYSTLPTGAVGAGANNLAGDAGQHRSTDANRPLGKPPAPPDSTASSADGYESFENTSNKKKRKIPLSSASSMHHSTLSAEMASMGISGRSDSTDKGGLAAPSSGNWTQTGVPPVGQTGGTGISGAGRGRYGRQNARHDVRKPLGSSAVNAVNGYVSRGPARAENKSAVPSAEEKGGIITRAIKSAAEQGPLTPQRGKENVSSLLQQQSSATPKSATPKTQFTFSCESDSSTRMVDAAAQQAAAGRPEGYGTPTPAGYTRGSMNSAMPGPPPGAKEMNTQGTQTAPTQRGYHPAVATGRPPPLPANQQLPPGQQQSPPKPKPRRSPSKEYATAARRRKLQQEYQNYHNRPKRDDMWICEFCEYEDIFGQPPVALIRSYEIKDRAERKKAAEKRRLLEKAKMKNRKGKNNKSNKKNANATNNGATAPTAGAHQQYDPNLPPPGEEEYYDDEYDGDEYEPMGPDDDDYPPQGYYPPPPAPAGTPSIGTPGGGGHSHNPGHLEHRRGASA